MINAQQELLAAAEREWREHQREVSREGCTDVLVAVSDGSVIGHNEDAGAGLRQGPGAIVSMQFDGKPRLKGFCYPGGLPGWGPCWNSAGVGYTINFLYPTLGAFQSGEKLPVGVTTAVLARTFAECRSLL